MKQGIRTFQNIGNRRFSLHALLFKGTIGILLLLGTTSATATRTPNQSSLLYARIAPLDSWMEMEGKRVSPLTRQYFSGSDYFISTTEGSNITGQFMWMESRVAMLLEPGSELSASVDFTADSKSQDGFTKKNIHLHLHRGSMLLISPSEGTISSNFSLQTIHGFIDPQTGFMVEVEIVGGSKSDESQTLVRVLESSASVIDTSRGTSAVGIQLGAKQQVLLGGEESSSSPTDLYSEYDPDSLRNLANEIAQEVPADSMGIPDEFMPVDLGELDPVSPSFLGPR